MSPPRAPLIILLLALLGAGLPAAADLVDRVAASLGEIARPLTGPGDLDPLLDAIGDRQTVLLGEASHGTREYYAWRSAITRRLVQEEGFRLIMLEADWVAIDRVNRFVKHRADAPGSAREALLALDRWPRWMWANPEFLELVEWLHAFNRDRDAADRVGLYGMDVYGAAESAELAPEYLSRIDPDAARAMRAALACYAPYIDSARAYHTALQRGREHCGTVLETMRDDLRDRREAHRRRDAHAYFHAKQNAALIVRAEQHVRAMTQQDATAWNARAGNFYETLARVREHEGRQREQDPKQLGVVAWAHNTHIGDARAVQAQPGQENLGQHARQALGPEQVFIVGFGSHRGSVLAGRRWEGPAEEMVLPEGANRSLEDILQRAGRGDALFLMDDVRGVSALRMHPVSHRAVGVVYHPEREVPGNYVPSLWPDRYDAFLFIERTHAIAQLGE